MGGDAGRAATGLAYMQEAVELEEQVYQAEQDPRVRSRKGLALAQSMLQIARQHHQQQDPEKAVGIYTRARGLVQDFFQAYPLEKAADNGDQVAVASEALQKAHGHATFVLSEILTGLGVAYNEVGRAGDSLATLQEALEVRKSLVGKSHPAIAECLNNLGALFFARGAHQKAAEYYEQAHELLVAASEGREEGIYTALALYNIGVCRAEMGHEREASVALNRALRIAERSLGSDHVQVDLIKETMQKYSSQRARPGPGSSSPQEPGAPPGAAPKADAGSSSGRPE